MIEWLKQMAEETIMTLTQTDDRDTTTQARHRRTGALGSGLADYLICFYPPSGRARQQKIEDTNGMASYARNPLLQLTWDADSMQVKIKSSRSAQLSAALPWSELLRESSTSFKKS